MKNDIPEKKAPEGVCWVFFGARGFDAPVRARVGGLVVVCVLIGLRGELGCVAVAPSGTGCVAIPRGRPARLFLFLDEAQRYVMEGLPASVSVVFQSLLTRDESEAAAAARGEWGGSS